MENNGQLIEPGKIIAFSRGAYSGYDFIGIVVTLQKLNLTELSEQYKSEFEPDEYYDEPQPERFPTWLINKGMAAPLEWQKIHCGEYGEFGLTLE
ncbi:hypothetical protein GCM10007094_23140 [Pseudovibrio japonicus]|uniref:ASCH domain-containing protein n=1 Tax=Pseudovibrio japonicus TaxID=366534 RepID=A0ABQ3EED7_9HYPH|nr:hypothetical protein [Pseudovibrio japonicus]GHB33703.1 hypothetical protein GCM10007094_23140 [Pseudovibrio japonicus]